MISNNYFLIVRFTCSKQSIATTVHWSTRLTVLHPFAVYHIRQPIDVQVDGSYLHDSVDLTGLGFNFSPSRLATQVSLSRVCVFKWHCFCFNLAEICISVHANDLFDSCVCVCVVVVVPAVSIVEMDIQYNIKVQNLWHLFTLKTAAYLAGTQSISRHILG